MIRIFDGNNYYRRELEQNPTGMAPRAMLAGVKPGDMWVWDGFNSNARRRELFPGYKVGREKPGANIYASFKLLQEVLTHSTAIQIQVPEYEADDVVATVARRLAEQGHQVGIHSNDLDFLQLSAEFPRHVFCGCNPKIPADLVRYYKVCVGDPSDKIPGIKGFGQKTWDGVDKTALKDAIHRWVAGELVPLDGLSKASLNWLEENLSQVATYWKVVGFYEVPPDLIDQHTRIGKPNYAAADARLKEFFL